MLEITRKRQEMLNKILSSASSAFVTNLTGASVLPCCQRAAVPPPARRRLAVGLPARSDARGVQAGALPLAPPAIAAHMPPPCATWPGGRGD